MKAVRPCGLAPRFFLRSFLCSFSLVCVFCLCSCDFFCLCIVCVLASGFVCVLRSVLVCVLVCVLVSCYSLVIACSRLHAWLCGVLCGD